MKELIERLRDYDINGKIVHAAADALEQQVKQIEELKTKLKYASMAANAEAEELDRANARIEELAAALAVKDEAIRYYATGGCNGTKLAEALSLQPRAALVAKIKADAVRGAVSHFEELGFTGWATTELLSYADRIEKGEVE